MISNNILIKGYRNILIWLIKVKFEKYCINFIEIIKIDITIEK